jgi:glycerol-3-phosphate dehydrogenase
LALRHPELPEPLLHRLARAYGSRVVRVLHDGQLGPEVAPGLHEAEPTYLCRHEWAQTADDVLWRRSKLGLHYREPEREAVAAWFERHRR